MDTGVCGSGQREPHKSPIVCIISGWLFDSDNKFVLLSHFLPAVLRFLTDFPNHSDTNIREYDSSRRYKSEERFQPDTSNIFDASKKQSSVPRMFLCDHRPLRFDSVFFIVIVRIVINIFGYIVILFGFNMQIAKRDIGHF